MLKYSMDDTVWVVVDTPFYQYITTNIHEFKAHILLSTKNILVTEGNITGKHHFEIRALGNKEELEERIQRAAKEEIKINPVIRLSLIRD